jgi:hypothetical protein
MGALATAVASVALCAPGVAQAISPISISGNHFVDGSGNTVRLIGVNRSGSEYSCSSDDGAGGFGYGFFQGPVNDRAIKAMRKWKVNAVALPLNEACWLGGIGGLNPNFSGAPYQAAIQDYVNRLNAKGIYVVLRLSGSGPGDNVYGSAPGDSEMPMADEDHSLDFWTSVASTFASNPYVVFHSYDEPHKIDWPCLLNGCEVDANGSEGEPKFGKFQAAGQQALVNAIRATGATQPIIISGINFAGDLSEWLTYKPADPLNQLAAGWNDFDYAKNLRSSKGALATVAQSNPIVIGGFGDTDCDSDYSEKIMKFADQQGISYLAWTWNTEADYGGCSNALLGPTKKAYYTGHPSGFGKGIRKHYRHVKHS